MRIVLTLLVFRLWFLYLLVVENLLLRWSGYTRCILICSLMRQELCPDLHCLRRDQCAQPPDLVLGWVEWSSFSYGYSPNHSKTGPFKIFVQISNGLWQNGGHVSGFQIMGLLDFRSLLKSRPLSTQLLLDHLKSRLGQISDPHCIWFSNGWASRFQTWKS